MDLRVTAMEEYFTPPKSPGLEPHHKIDCPKQYNPWWRVSFILPQRCSWHILQPQLTGVMNTWIYIYIYIYLSLSLSLSLYIYIYIYIYEYSVLEIEKGDFGSALTAIGQLIYIYIYIYTYIYICVCVCVYMHIYVYMYVYVYNVYECK